MKKKDLDLFSFIHSYLSDWKESAKETASEGMQSLKDTGSEISEKGHGKWF